MGAAELIPLLIALAEKATDLVYTAIDRFRSSGELTEEQEGQFQANLLRRTSADWWKSRDKPAPALNEQAPPAGSA